MVLSKGNHLQPKLGLTDIDLKELNRKISGVGAEVLRRCQYIKGNFDHDPALDYISADELVINKWVSESGSKRCYVHIKADKSDYEFYYFLIGKNGLVRTFMDCDGNIKYSTLDNQPFNANDIVTGQYVLSKLSECGIPFNHLMVEVPSHNCREEIANSLGKYEVVDFSEVNKGEYFARLNMLYNS